MNTSTAQQSFFTRTADPGRPEASANPSVAAPGFMPALRWPHRQETAKLRAELPAVSVGAGAPRAEPTLLERLAAIDGLDVDLALRYSAGQLPVLARVLRRFVATYRQGLPAFLDLTGDEHEVVLRWRTACHSVRGALGMIGATQLIDAVTGFERELNELATLASLSAAGREVHDRLVEFVRQLAAELESGATARG